MKIIYLVPAVLALLMAVAGYCLTHPMPVKGGTCIVFDGPNYMHCKGFFHVPGVPFIVSESWGYKND